MERIRGWDDEQFNEALALRNDGLTYREIGKLTGRTADAVRAKFRMKAGWRPRPEGAKCRGPSDRVLQAYIIKQDKAFQRRMRAAIRFGYENAPIGVFVDTRPFDKPPFQFRDVIQVSGAGSSAALCAELGRSLEAPRKP
jgi:hypothetical protein